MTIKTTKSLLIGAIASLGLTLGAADALAQNFNTGNSSNYVAPANPAQGGIVRMRHKTGELTGKYGKSEANRMPGTVIWMCKQTIPGGTFFTNIETDPTDNKTFGPGTIDISGDFKPGTTGPGKLDFTNSDIKFSGNDPAKPQVIPPVNKDNTGNTGFDKVTLTGDAPKETVPCGTTGGDNTYIAQLNHTGAALTNKGNLILGGGASGTPVTHTSATLINDPGAASNCGITLNAYGPLDVATLTNTSGHITMPDNGTINLTGAFTHTSGNMNFACESNFNYTGTAAQTITPTTGTAQGSGFYAYGNLGVSNSAKVAGGDFRVCNDYKASSELDNAPNTADYTMTLLNSTNGDHAKFSDGVEVRGKVKYATLTPGTEYTFNNAATKVTFEAAPTDFTLDVRQATAPNKALNISTVQDISRQINVAYTGTGIISSFKTMWETGDEGVGFDGSKVAQMKLAEGYDVAKERKKIIRVGATTTVDAVAKTIVYAGGVNGADGINLVAGSAPTGTIDFQANRNLYNGSQVMLSTKPQQVVSIANGRWSNPTTWDTGNEPNAADEVLLTKTVWVGDTRGLFGGSAYTPCEAAVTAGVAAAKSITIANESGAGLYISNEDGNMSKVNNNEVNFHTVMESSATAVAGIFNNNSSNTQTNTNATFDPTSAASMNGIWIASVTNNYKPVLGAAQFDNQGSMVNYGIAEVGTCVLP